MMLNQPLFFYQISRIYSNRVTLAFNFIEKMRQIEDIKDGRGIDGMIFLSEFYSDNKVKELKFITDLLVVI